MKERPANYLKSFDRFKDFRLKKRFGSTIQGIIGAKTSRVLPIANNPPPKDAATRSIPLKVSIGFWQMNVSQ